MSYECIGKFSGNLEALRASADELLLAAGAEIFNFAGYKATRDGAAVVEAFRPRLGQVFPGPWVNGLITQVMPSGCIPPHNDVPQPDTLRYHLVLASNPLSWVMHDGEWQQLDEGGVYRMNARRQHAAINWGPVPRTHLVVDVDTRFLDEE